MARRRNRDIRLAKQLAKVKFGPEQSTIKAALDQAKNDYVSDVTSADAASKSAIHFAKKAKKPVAQVFNTARAEADAAHADVEAAFGKIGAGADPFRAVTAREQAGAHTRVALAGANALHELTQRQLEAKAGGLYAKRKAKDDFHKTLSDLSTRLSDLQGRQRADIGATVGQLTNERRDRNAATHNIKLKANLDAAAEGGKVNQYGYSNKDWKALPTARRQSIIKDFKGSGGGGGGSSKGLGGNKPASRSEMRMFKSDFAKALSYAKQYGSRADARAELIPGAPAAKDKKGRLIPATPSIDDQLALSTALDMAFDGHVSRANARELHKAGIRVKELPGAKTYSQWNKGRSGSRIRSGPLGY